MRKPLLFLALSLLFSFALRAEENRLLDKEITLKVENERLDDFLNRLSQEVGGVFSYSPSVIDIEKRISGEFTNESCREILEAVFQGSIQYKEKGNYIIISPAPPPEKEITISGYLVDENSGERIRNATVYDPITLKSSTTDEFGFFEIEVKNPSENFELIINQERYSDTLLVDQKRSSFSRVFLTKETAETLTKPMKDFLQWAKESIGVRNSKNVRDTLSRKFQFSILPFVGTNSKLSGNVVNDYSVNLLGGYSAGTNKFEIGGLFNLDRGEVSGLQLAGLFNQVGGDVRGAQFAGLANVNLDSLSGFQGAGIINFNLRDVKGVQASPLLNISGGNTQGFQGSALINYTHRNVEGVQAAILGNIAGGAVNGFQFGLFNYADSVKGASIGLLSFVRKGYHTVEIGADEIYPTNIALRTGTRAFYNILSAGIRPEQADSVTWSFGYGIGTSPRLGKKLYLNFELNTSQMNKGNVLATNLISRAYLGLDYQLAKGVALYAGPSFNIRIFDTSYDDHPETFAYFTPRVFGRNTFESQNLGQELWWGFRAGIRFF
ncbi:STN and carboxypeptidase regulatory-like domain-containing protein [Algoriphagus sediminis]|uniref:STN and carboxypeptidase regulatory-like domain-containing protein n=1 Tax=Algoriphagus sediminis TaxID=3057113 RepID=A0ABT7YFF5_9BACT|nr:STN and carboxypeptidase regulatory-like domain-containing protein [Algoriphagus sediminis]MDN3205261.1 STN and carboxypeptidase regulatory-like domain-containing protein [Algoriphagus sediminis]